MLTLRFKSCVIGPPIPLDKPASFFRIERTASWKEYVELTGRHLESILQKPCEDKRVYLFEYGSIGFLNFNEGELQIFLDFFAGLVDEVGIQPSLELDRTGCRCRLSGDRV